MENIIVGIAEYRVGGASQSLSAYALGSCVALAMHDPVALVGGLVHFMLPDSGLDPPRARERPGMFADTGIAVLLEQLQQRGACHTRLVARAAGAAAILDPEGFFDIGGRNCAALHGILNTLRIPLASEAFGGTHSRNVRLEIDSGRFLVYENVAPPDTPVCQGKGAAKPCPRDGRSAF